MNNTSNIRVDEFLWLYTGEMVILWDVVLHVFTNKLASPLKYLVPCIVIWDGLRAVSLTIINDNISYIVIFVYELECDYRVQSWRHVVRGIDDTGRKLYLYLEKELRPFFFLWCQWPNDSISAATLNVEKCSLCQDMPDCSVLGTSFQLFCRYTNKFDRLFDAVLLSSPWMALVPVTL